MAGWRYRRGGGGGSACFCSALYPARAVFACLPACRVLLPAKAIDWNGRETWDKEPRGWALRPVLRVTASWSNRALVILDYAFTVPFCQCGLLPMVGQKAGANFPKRRRP